MHDEIPIQLRFIQMSPTALLAQAIEKALLTLEPHRGRIELCDLQITRVQQYQRREFTIQVTLTIEVRSARAFSVHCESGLRPSADAPAILVREAFERAEHRLEMIEKREGQLAPVHELRPARRREEPDDPRVYDDLD